MTYEFNYECLNEHRDVSKYTYANLETGELDLTFGKEANLYTEPVTSPGQKCEHISSCVSHTFVLGASTGEPGVHSIASVSFLIQRTKVATYFMTCLCHFCPGRFNWGTNLATAYNGMGR